MGNPSLHLSDDASPAKKDLPLVSAYLSPDSGSDYSAYDDSDPNRTSSDEDVYPNPAIYILDRYFSNDVNDYKPALPDSENSSLISSGPKKIVANCRIPKYRRHRADKIRVGINGFGRIGRLVATVMLERSDKVELVAINDSLKTIETMKHKFDKEDYKLTPLVVVGTPFAVKGLLFGDNPVYVFDVGVDFVVESTGVFTEKDKAAAHLKGGARKVVISGQSKDAPTIVLGVNEDDYKADVDVVCLPNSNNVDSSLVDLIVHMWTAKGFRFPSRGELTFLRLNKKLVFPMFFSFVDYVFFFIEWGIH